MEIKTEEMVTSIAQAIYDRKGFNIIALDVRKISSITDYFIIAEGNIDRHVIALAHEVKSRLSDLGEKAFRIEGEDSGDWLVIDYLNVIVHIFTPEMREKYQLEKLWQDGKIVDLKIQTSDTQTQVT